MNVLFSFILTIIFFIPTICAALTNQECSHIIIGIMKDKGLIDGGEQGICVGDITDLSNVKFGLGSNTFELGKADKQSIDPGTYPGKLKEIMNIMTTGSGKSTLNTTVIGYADGVSGPSTFDKYYKKNSISAQDIDQEFSNDPATKKRLFEIIDFSKNKSYKFISQDSDPDGIPNSALSLIRNFYLSKERAKLICQSLYDQQTANTQCNKNNVKNYTSPLLEQKERALQNCPNRRTALIHLDLINNASPKNPGGDNIFSPNFEMAQGIFQRDLQLAATSSFIGAVYKERAKREQVGDSSFSDPCDPKNNDTIKALNSKCQKVPNAVENGQLLYCHTSTKLNTIDDKQFKDKFTDGDYTYLKKRFTDLSSSENSELTPDQRKQLSLLEIMINGNNSNNPYMTVSRKDDKQYPTFKNPIPVKINGRNIYARNYIVNANGQCELLYHYINDQGIVEIERINTKKNCDDIKNGDNFKDIPTQLSKTNNYKVSDSRFPNSSHLTPSTDIFNCYSQASAIEDNFKDPSKSMLIDPSLIMTEHSALPDSDKLNIFLNPKKVANITTKNGEKKQGFICEMCGKGIEFHKDGSSFSTREEPPHTQTQEKLISSLSSQKDLSVGSTKSLNVFNIKRSDLYSAKVKCPSSSTVCQCLKDMEIGKGNLQNVLKNADIIDVVHSKESGNKAVEKNLKGDSLFGFHNDSLIGQNRTDNCLFVPPVSPVCKVKPSGKESDVHPNDNQSPSCEFVDKLAKAGHRLKPNAAYLQMNLRSVKCQPQHFTTSEMACLEMEKESTSIPTASGSVENK